MCLAFLNYLMGNWNQVWEHIRALDQNLNCENFNRSYLCVQNQNKRPYPAHIWEQWVECNSVCCLCAHSNLFVCAQNLFWPIWKPPKPCYSTKMYPRSNLKDFPTITIDTWVRFPYPWLSPEKEVSLQT